MPKLSSPIERHTFFSLLFFVYCSHYSALLCLLLFLLPTAVLLYNIHPDSPSTPVSASDCGIVLWYTPRFLSPLSTLHTGRWESTWLLLWSEQIGTSFHDCSKSNSERQKLLHKWKIFRSRRSWSSSPLTVSLGSLQIACKARTLEFEFGSDHYDFRNILLYLLFPCHYMTEIMLKHSDILKSDSTYSWKCCNKFLKLLDIYTVCGISKYLSLIRLTCDWLPISKRKQNNKLQSIYG